MNSEFLNDGSPTRIKNCWRHHYLQAFLIWHKGWWCHSTFGIYYDKVQIFWESHKNLKKSPNSSYSQSNISIGRFFHIFLAFSKYLNFSNSWQIIVQQKLVFRKFSFYTRFSHPIMKKSFLYAFSMNEKRFLTTRLLGLKCVQTYFTVKFGHYEKATKIWNNLPLELKFYLVNIKSSGRLFQNLWPS